MARWSPSRAALATMAASTTAGSPPLRTTSGPFVSPAESFALANLPIDQPEAMSSSLKGSSDNPSTQRWPTSAAPSPRPSVDPATEDQAAADPAADGDIEDGREPHPGAVEGLAESGGVGVVLDRDEGI